MTITGIGLAPFGTSLFGIGAIETTAPTPSDTLLTATRQQGTCRLLDPITKSYTFDASGNMLGMSTAQQMVELALTDDRILKLKTTVVTSALESQIKIQINAALKSFVDAEMITIKSISTNVYSNKLFINVQWIDDANNLEQTTSL